VTVEQQKQTTAREREREERKRLEREKQENLPPPPLDCLKLDSIDARDTGVSPLNSSAELHSSMKARNASLALS
jgi:hypothetical protein